MIAGRSSGIETSAYVYLPPEYFQDAYARRKFPAVVVLTGYPGTAENLIKGLDYPKTSLGRVRAGRSQPMILVMLRPTVAPPRDTECVDIEGGPKTETFFADDLRPPSRRRTGSVGTPGTGGSWATRPVDTAP